MPSVASEANPSLKWKGPSSTQNPPIEYDVDDPTFCSPKSVLSGLASGFCERWAINHQEFVVAYDGQGDSTTLNWNHSNSNSRTAYRTSIVSNFVENLIAYNGAEVHLVSSAFLQNNGTFMAPQHPVAGSSANYMTNMDHMITQLITNGGYYTNNTTDADPYVSFNQLALAAHNNAPTTPAASSCGLPVSRASAYTSQFMPAYPAAWAKERKWMLEQLRYRREPAVQTSMDDIIVYGLSTYAENSCLIYKSRGSAAISSFVSSGISALTSMSVLGGTVTASCYASGDISSSVPLDTEIAPVSSVFVGSITTAYADTGEWVDGYAANATFSVWENSTSGTAIQLPYTSASPDHAGFCYGMEVLASSGQTGPVDVGVYFTAPCVIDRPDIKTINYHLSDDSVDYTVGTDVGSTAHPSSSILIKSGGKIDITGGTVKYLCISAGGTALVGPAAVIGSCNIMNGGVLVPTGGTLTLGVIKADYRCMFGREDAISLHTFGVLSGSARVDILSGTSASSYHDYYWVIASGADAVIIAEQQVTARLLVLRGGTATILTGEDQGYFTVHEGGVMQGGTLSMGTSDGEILDCAVANGGDLNISAAYGGQGINVLLYSGGSMYVGPGIDELRELHIEHGASISWATRYVSDTSNIGEVYMYVYTDFGMRTVDSHVISQGWNFIQTAASAGDSGSVVGKLIGWPTTSSAPVVAKESIVSNTTYPNFYDSTLGYNYLSNVRCTINAGIRPLAINGGTAKPIPFDIYSGFKLRQNES